MSEDDDLRIAAFRCQGRDRGVQPSEMVFVDCIVPFDIPILNDAKLLSPVLAVVSLVRRDIAVQGTA